MTRRSPLRTARSLVWLACAALAAPAGAVTFAEAYQAAVRHDAQFQAARHELDAARQEYPIARASLLPQVSLNASTSKVKGEREFANALSQEVQVPLDYTAPSASISMRTPLFNYEALSRVRQVSSAIEAAEENYRAQHLDLVNRLGRGYLQLVAAVDGKQLAEWEIEALQGQVQRARQRQQRGEGTVTEVARTESALELARARLLEANDVVGVARQAFKRVTGLDGDQLAKPSGGFKADPLLPERLQEWMDLAMRQNPVVRRAEYNVATARIGIDRTRAGHYPRLDLVASVGRSRNESPTNIGQTSTVRSVGVQLNVPIYSGGGVQASVRQAVSERDRAEETLRAERDAVLLDVERYFRIASSGPQRLQSLERAVEAGQLELRGALRSQEAGMATIGDVLDARTRYNTAVRDLAQARLEYLENRLRLLTVAGLPVDSALEDIGRVLTDHLNVPNPTPTPVTRR